MSDAMEKISELKRKLQEERAEKERIAKEKAEREAEEHKEQERKKTYEHIQATNPDELFMMEFYSGRHTAVRCSDGIGSGAAFKFCVPGHRDIVGLLGNLGVTWYYQLIGGTWTASTLAGVLVASEINEKKKATYPA